MSNFEAPNDEGMTRSEARNDGSGRRKEKIYDLEERTARFGEAVIEFLKTISVTPITKSLIEQLVRSATSVGANYCETASRVSNRDYFTTTSFRVDVASSMTKSAASSALNRPVSTPCMAL